MKRLLLISLVFGIVFCEEDPCNSKKREGLVPDPKNCSNFYQCTSERSFHFVCPGGLHFNSKIRVCDYPANAGCTVREPPSPGNSSSEKPGQDERVPCSSEGDESLLPDPQSCSSYYQCDHGQRVKRPCPTGLHFNLDLQLCDWPANAGCEEGSGDDGSGDGEGIGSTSKSDNEESQEQSGDENNETSSQPGNCGNIAHDDRTPDPRDCGQYYHCVWGKNVHMPCPAGLHFNPSLKVCDYPFQAQCKVDILEDTA